MPSLNFVRIVFFKLEICLREAIGGDLQRYELVDHTILLNDAPTHEIFRRRGCLYYCLSLKGFNKEVSLQFMSTLKDEVAEVKGLKIEFIEDVVIEVIGLPQDGEPWVKYFDL